MRLFGYGLGRANQGGNKYAKGKDGEMGLPRRRGEPKRRRIDSYRTVRLVHLA